MKGGEAEVTLRASAVRLNHRLRRFAGANLLKKIALNVIAKVIQALPIKEPVCKSNVAKCAVKHVGVMHVRDV